MTLFKKILLLSIFLLFSCLLNANDSPSFILPIGKDRSPKYEEFQDRIIGNFGDKRTSKTAGHKHSGIDIIAKFKESVFAIGKGVVINVFREFPHKTVLIKHHYPNGKIFYSSYVHLSDLEVSIGEYVDKDSKLGRIFDEGQLRKSEFATQAHIHFEIRHSIEDKGDATFTCMTLEELDRYFIDPKIFFSNYLNGNYNEQQ
jgi:murein DD-endopeptidase MepM/ murein hydrolase activator NlpD